MRGSMGRNSSTYQSPQHVAEMGFLAIQRFEGYPRTALDRVLVHKKGGLTHLPPAFCDAEGFGLKQWVTITIVTGQWPVTHELENIFRFSTS